MHHHAKPFVDEQHAERARRRARAELERLVNDAASDDAAAWTALVKRFGPWLHATARAEHLGVHDAEDIAQATWLKLLTHIRSVREPAKIGGYLQTIARHTSWRHATTAYRVQLLPEGVDEAVGGVQPGPEEGLISKERSSVLAAALERLPERDRRLMTMLIQEPEPSYAEIASKLDMPIGSIGPTRARCLARLRRDPRLAAIAAVS